jgi:hypothetical protein
MGKTSRKGRGGDITIRVELDLDLCRGLQHRGVLGLEGVSMKRNQKEGTYRTRWPRYQFLLQDQEHVWDSILVQDSISRPA